MATLSYSYADGVVYLEELSAEDHPMVHDLCRPHASTVRVPRGWTLSDHWSAAAATVEQSQLDLIGA